MRVDGSLYQLYLEGRRTRESRVNRAVDSRSTFGRQAIAGQWASAEFTVLARLSAAGVPVTRRSSAWPAP